MSTVARLAPLASPTTLGLTAAAVSFHGAQEALGLSRTDGSILVAFTVALAIGTPLASRVIRVRCDLVTDEVPQRTVRK